MDNIPEEPHGFLEPVEETEDFVEDKEHLGKRCCNKAVVLRSSKCKEVLKEAKEE